MNFNVSKEKKKDVEFRHFSKNWTFPTACQSSVKQAEMGRNGGTD